MDNPGGPVDPSVSIVVLMGLMGYRMYPHAPLVYTIHSYVHTDDVHVHSYGSMAVWRLSHYPWMGVISGVADGSITRSPAVSASLWY